MGDIIRGRHIGWNDRPHGPEFYLESAPTISPDVFAAQLRRRNSPVLQEADPLSFYNAVLTRGLNPAVALGFFGKESQYGADTASPVVQAGAKNWGNLTQTNLADGPPYGRAHRTVHITVFGETHDFRAYDTWMDGLLDWCDHVQSPQYKGKTIRDALKIYVGPSYNSYADQVQAWMQAWDQASGAFDILLPGVPLPPVPPCDYPLLGPPSISSNGFTATLAAANSPVLEETDGGEYFDLCTANNVDPAVALAFFAQETNYGTAPGEAELKNWGNLWDASAHSIGTYPAWLLGLRDWCNRLQGPAYTAHGAPTISSIVPLYRGNRADNDQYIRNLCTRIDLLREMPR
ncbi:MAG: hypothetical protein ACR2M0_14375 [Chloroflexia bacterium]